MPLPSSRITVITAVFNGAETIEKSILSVIGQTYDNVEYIVIDGGSTDGTQEIIKRHEHAIDYWISEPDTGIYDAWNKGVQQAKGEWIAFLGADDVFVDGALQAYAESISARSDRQLQYMSSKVNLVSDGRVIRTIGQPWVWSIFRKHMNVAHVGSLHHRELFEQYGLFDTSYRICGDYEFLLRFREALKAGYLDQITVNMSIGGISSTSPKVFSETTQAKIITGGRAFIPAHLEKLVALCKWKLRSWLWY